MRLTKQIIETSYYPELLEARLQNPNNRSLF